MLALHIDLALTLHVPSDEKDSGNNFIQSFLTCLCLIFNKSGKLNRPCIHQSHFTGHQPKTGY